MPKGGYKPGGGRPKGVKNSTGVPPKKIVAEAYDAGLTPKDYMLRVMRDPDADKARRDRMAIAVAPYVHERPGEATPGKKEARDNAAKTAGQGTEWGDDLAPRVSVN